MKILTFNTHSLEEANMPQKQKQFVQALKQLDPDIVALQEVNQTNTCLLYTSPSPRDTR